MKNGKWKILHRSNNDFHDTFLHKHSIPSQLVRYRKALATPHIKLPSMPITLDGVAAEHAFTQGSALVRTIIADGIEFAVYVEDGNFGTV
jgi:hypothetical protein